MSTRVSLPELKIASPCPARWVDMPGDDRKHFCDACGEHVHNLAAMRDSEIAALVEGGTFCGQIYRRADGTILTADCPVGVRLARTRMGRVALRAAAASFALLATTAAAIGATTWGQRILSSGLNATIGKLQAEGRVEALSGGLTWTSLPATQPISGEVEAVPTVGIVALPSSQPAE